MRALMIEHTAIRRYRHIRILSELEIVLLMFSALNSKILTGLNIAIGAKENKMESFSDLNTFFLPKYIENPQ